MHNAAILIVSTLLLATLSGCLDGTGTSIVDTPATGPAQNETAALAAIDWALDLEGDLAVSFTVHPQEKDTTDCDIHLDYQDGSPDGAHWTAFVVGDQRPRPVWVVVGSKTHVAQVHLGDQVDTRPYTPQLGANQRITLEWEAVGVPAAARYTFAVTGLEAQGSGAEPSVILRASCDDATLQNVSAGRTVSLFDASTLQTGFSATVNTPAPGAGAAVSLFDQTGRRIQEETGRVVLVALYAMAASIEVAHPSGETRTEWVPSLEGPSPFFAVEEGPGDYHVVLTQAAWDGDDLVGTILGLDPFTTLDALQAATAHGHGCDHAHDLDQERDCAGGPATA